MKTSTSKVIVIARLLGTLGVIFSLLTFCTNCWLLATETCTQSENITEVDFEQRVQIALKLQPTPILKQINYQPRNRSEHDGPPKGHIQRRSIAETMKKIKHFPGSYNLFNKASGKTFHYEGFFWSCTMDVRNVEDSFSTYVFFEHAPSKSCIEAYHLPFPTRLNLNSSAYESAAGFRHSWSVLIVLSVFSVGIGFGLIVYEAFQGRDTLYLQGGGLFVLAVNTGQQLDVTTLSLFPCTDPEAPRYAKIRQKGLELVEGCPKSDSSVPTRRESWLHRRRLGPVLWGWRDSYAVPTE
ncbi:transmembrane protein 182-like [Rhincodon typus]|uniref:transmembrane protein 182-like n=1 Tax=Rhincodon typus TaxID=259920 RepID=UPI00202DB791|nr:transmembrane protein 182-like [Rhincodon typus]